MALFILQVVRMSIIKGSIGKITYNFDSKKDSDIGEIATRKAIGYATNGPFKCGTCKHFAGFAGRYGSCRKFLVGVEESACCSAWEK